MRVTARQLNRATLQRQLLLRRAPLTAAEAVRRVVAVQAQEAASPYVALWNRVAGFDPAELDAAYAEHTVVKGSLMRVTLHAVHAEDYPVFHSALQGVLREARLGDKRFAVAGLSVAEADALVPELLAFAAQPRTNAEFEALLDERIGVRPRPGVWWALRSSVPMVHAPTGGPWSFGPRPSYVAARAAPATDPPPQCLGRLIRRYLEGFGPASVPDIAQFLMLGRAAVRTAITTLGDTLCQLEGPAGVVYDVPGGTVPAEDTPAPPRLLAMWDSILLAYSDRTRIIPPAHRSLVIRVNGDSLPTLLVDGAVAGVWRPVEGGIEATAFEPLTEADWAGLATEAAALVAFLSARDPAAYRRYAHWWARLPPGDTRLLP